MRDMMREVISSYNCHRKVKMFKVLTVLDYARLIYLQLNWYISIIELKINKNIITPILDVTQIKWNK
jgi:hypothetical protein